MRVVGIERGLGEGFKIKKCLQEIAHMRAYLYNFGKNRTILLFSKILEFPQFYPQLRILSALQ